MKSDEGKRWTLRQHGSLWDVQGPSLQWVSQAKKRGSLREIEVVPATELDRLEAEEKNLRADLATEEENARAALSRAQAAEARVRELEGAIEEHRDGSYVRHGGEPAANEDGRLYDALNAPVEDGRT